MRILILGGTGMLGHKLVQVMSKQFEVFTAIRQPFDSVDRLGILRNESTFVNFDAEKPESIEAVIDWAKPDVVVNAVGVIKQLPTANDVITALTINSILPHRLARLSDTHGFRLICISTDCVFAGTKGNYTEQDTSDAYDLYGKSKSIGEVAQSNTLTLRTSIIGREIDTAHSLVEWFLSNRGGKVKGYTKAIYSGFPTIVLAEILSNIVTSFPGLSGLYHLSSDPISKFDLLKLIDEYYKTGIEIVPFEDFRIDRSLDSTKFRKATGYMPPDWRALIERMAEDPTPYEQWRS